MGPKPFSQEQFIALAKQTHGNRFIYSATKYINRRTKIEVTCRIHGKFTTSPTYHYKGNGGCQACNKITEVRKKGNIVTNGKARTRAFIPFKRFIKCYAKYDSTYIDKANKAHGNKYTYKVNTPILNTETHKFTITCPAHGEFVQSIKNHLQGQGCPSCGKEKARAIKTTPFKVIKERADKIHNSKYIYIEDSYTNTQTKMLIKCTSCDNNFYMTPDSHINQQQGCPYCRGMYKTLEDATKALNKIDKSYALLTNEPLTTTILNNSIIHFNCSTHGNTSRKFVDIARGLGCRRCKSRGFTVTKPGILYYLAIDNGTAYKIGITNNSVSTRFNSEELSTIKIIKEWYFEDGYECYQQEQRILKQYKDFKYQGPSLLSNGNTELFSKDILMLDTSNNL